MACHFLIHESVSSQGTYSASEWEDNLSPVAQPNLNYLAPEYVLTLSCDTASDLFSLGMLMYSTVNRGKPLYDNNENLRTFKQNCSQVRLSLSFRDIYENQF